MHLIGKALGESALFTFTHGGYNLRGVIHVGANEGQEVGWYVAKKLLPLVCFEPHPDAYRRMVEKWAPHSDDIEFVPCALGAEDGNITMRVPADGDDEKTSAYQPIPTPGHDWTDVPPGETLVAPVRRFDSWAADRSDLDMYNALSVDVQGMEMDVLLGFGRLLDGFEYLCIELSDRPVYRGEFAASYVIRWLAERGFSQESEVQEHEDVLFRRR